MASDSPVIAKAESATFEAFSEERFAQVPISRLIVISVAEESESAWE